jgi:hypothetical protein
LITKEKKSITSCYIHRSKLIKITTIDARFGKTCWSMVFLTMTSFHKRKPTRKFDHKGIGVKLTYKAKHFHNWTRACNPYKYKTPNLLKITIDVHPFFVCLCGTKKINNCSTLWTYPFLPQLGSMNNKFYHLFIELLFPFIK